MYPFVITQNLTKTSEYKECFQLLSFHSKEELCSKLKKITNVISKRLSIAVKNKLRDIIDRLDGYINEMNNFDMDDLTSVVNEIEEEVDVNLQNCGGRQQFREVQYYYIV